MAAKKDTIKATSSAKAVDGEKSAEQRKRLEKIREQKEADQTRRDKAKAAVAEAEAAAAEEAARKAAEEQARAEAEAAAAEEAAKEAASKTSPLASIKLSSEDKEQLAGVAGTLGAAAIGALKARQDDEKDKDVKAETDKDAAAKGSSRKRRNIVPLVVLGVIAVAIVAIVALNWKSVQAMLGAGNEASEVTVAENLGNSTDDLGFGGFTQADFSEAILGEAREEQLLVVWEQDVEVETELTDELLGIGLFKKTKTMRSYGTGVYTVDLSKVDDAHVTLDEDTKTVTVSIPHTCLQYINFDLDKTEFEETDHAILGFGDITLTEEEHNIVERQVEESMRETLTEDERYAEADDAALLKVYETFAPVVEKVSDEYGLEVEFDEATENEDVS